jgi:hypothetical protein
MNLRKRKKEIFSYRTEYDKMTLQFYDKLIASEKKIESEAYLKGYTKAKKNIGD